MQPQHKNRKNIGITLGVIVIIGVIVATVLGDRQSTQSSTTSDQSSSDTSTQTTPVETPVSTPSRTPSVPTTTPADIPPKTVSASVYKDGTYSATGSYMSPGGEDQLAVTVSITNDIVTDVSVTPQAGDRTSARYQDFFISGYKQYVVGKNIGSIYLTKVSRSSLTPVGFNDALAQIKAQAKA